MYPSPNFRKPDQFDLWFGQDESNFQLPQQIKRKIIHVDMDAFYASIEEREDPKLKHLPLVIGGSPESRAVVCTANYIARKYGIRSAMPCSKAARLCANAVFIPPRFELYSQVSDDIHEIFAKYTDLIEPLSLDEAFLDVTHCNIASTATEIAHLIKKDIFEKTGLTASAGVAPNKMIAKIASDINKPNGIFVVKPHHAKNFVKNLQIKKIPGIGPVAAQQLAEIGIKVCSDIWQIDKQLLQDKMGKRFAQWILPLSFGIDNRSVETERKRKSFSYENTFNIDLTSLSAIKTELLSLCRQLCFDLQNQKIKGKTINFKLRYHDFQTMTRSKSIDQYTNSYDTISPIIIDLLQQNYELKRPVRLLGVGLSKLLEADDMENSLF